MYVNADGNIVGLKEYPKLGCSKYNCEGNPNCNCSKAPMRKYSADAEQLIYQEKVTPEVADKVKQIARDLRTDPNWIMTVMNAESKLNPQAVNPLGGATGLIQFMPDTAIGLGTTTAALKQMNALQQLDYVEKYFQPYAGRLNSYYDVYSVVFFPAIIGKPDDWTLQTSKLSADTVSRNNPAISKFGYPITVGSFKKYVESTVPTAWQDIESGVKKFGATAFKVIKTHKAVLAIILGAGLAMGIGIALITRKPVTT
jgi:hypothetical protein